MNVLLCDEWRLYTFLSLHIRQEEYLMGKFICILQGLFHLCFWNVQRQRNDFKNSLHVAFVAVTMKRWSIVQYAFFVALKPHAFELNEGCLRWRIEKGFLWNLNSICMGFEDAFLGREGSFIFCIELLDTITSSFQIMILISVSEDGKLFKHTGYCKRTAAYWM